MANNDCINVCLATDKNYIQHAGAVIASILKHAAPEDELAFYILHEELTEQELKKIRALKAIRPCTFKFIVPELDNFQELKAHKYISHAALFTLQLPNLLPDVNRLIYVDCDLVVVTSLRELWETDIGDAIIGAVADYNSDLEEKQKSIGCEGFVYINSGAFIFNLDLARKNNTVASFLDTAADLKERATLLDQDVINAALKGKIYVLPLKWNLSTGYFKRKYEVQYYSDKEIIEAVKNPGVLHFSGKKKPWSWRRCRHAFWFEYFKAIKNTPWGSAYWSGIIKKVLFPYRKSSGPAADAFSSLSR